MLLWSEMSQTDAETFTMFCIKCREKKTVPADQTTASIADVACPKCGAKNRPQAEKCFECGWTLANSYDGKTAKGRSMLRAKCPNCGASMVKFTNQA
jgi:ribosomal protein S27E